MQTSSIPCGEAAAMKVLPVDDRSPASPSEEHNITIVPRGPWYVKPCWVSIISAYLTTTSAAPAP